MTQLLRTSILVILVIVIFFSLSTKYNYKEYYTRATFRWEIPQSLWKPELITYTHVYNPVYTFQMIMSKYMSNIPVETKPNFYYQDPNPKQHFYYQDPRVIFKRRCR